MTALNRIEFLQRVGLDHETLDVWVAEEWLTPSVGTPELEFAEIDIARAKLIRELIDDLGVNAEGVGIILNLLDQVHGLRNVMSELLQTMRVRPL